MPHKMPLSAMGITTARDLCVLDANPPPLSFETDLNLPPISIAPSYKSPSVDPTYWQPGGP